MPKFSYPPLKTEKKKKKPKATQTVNDFIAAALEFEESGDRWLNGDRPKAGRFYSKAIQAYTSALEKKPDSIDAAYNRARLQLTLASDGSLLPEINGQKIAMLEVALQAHRDCLQFDSENADILFNTAQALTLLADAYANDAKADGELGYSRKATDLLLEAFCIFDKTLEVQETEIRIMSIEAADIYMGNDGVPLPKGKHVNTNIQTHDNGEGEWALVRKPVTQEDVLDTILAKLEALTSLWGLCDHINRLPDPIEFVKFSGDEMVKKLSEISTKFSERVLEIFLTRADYLVAAADACYRCQKLSLEQFDMQVREGFDSKGTVDISSSPKLLGRKAEAHIQFCLTVSEMLDFNNHPQAATILWKHYGLAAKCLSGAATLDRTNPSLHCLRGDVEMWRSKLPLSVAKDSKSLLLKNAGVYYRGAVKVALASTKPNEDIVIEASVKEKLLAIEERGVGVLIEDMVNEIKHIRGWKEIVLDALRIGIFDASILTALGYRRTSLSLSES